MGLCRSRVIAFWVFWTLESTPDSQLPAALESGWPWNSESRHSDETRLFSVADAGFCYAIPSRRSIGLGMYAWQRLQTTADGWKESALPRASVHGLSAESEDE
jgi:hypothetical protein